jgi:hypothetical protein
MTNFELITKTDLGLVVNGRQSLTSTPQLNHKSRGEIHLNAYF